MGVKISDISKKQIPEGEEVVAKEIRKGIYALIKASYPYFNDESYISLAELNYYRRLYLTSLIIQEKGELEIIDRDVMDAIKNNAILSENIQDEIDEQITFGEKIADHIAEFGGSWTFIIAFFLFVVIWMVINVWLFIAKPFDPFPFILLNLILSCLAAIQAPIIMMSQNRMDKKDRQRSEHDYKINLKAELEIKLLSDKIDHLMVHQNNKLLEIQEIQIDYLEDLLKEIKKK